MTAREDVARWLYDDQRPATVTRWAGLPEWVREEWREKADPLLDALAPHIAAATAAARAEALAPIRDLWSQRYVAVYGALNVEVVNADELRAALAGPAPGAADEVPQ